jgi:RNA methyltransferase, TrmH family
VVFDNVNSDRVKRYRSLQQASARRRNGLSLVEGPNSVFAVAGHFPDKIETLYMTEAMAKRHSEIADVLRLSAKHYDTPLAPVTIATEEVIKSMSDNAQGVLAVIRTPEFDFGKQFSTPDEVVARALKHSDHEGVRTGPFLIAILHNVRDPGNAGTVIRSADAMGADLVILTGDSVEIANPKVIRSSAGSVFHVPVIAYKDLSGIVQSLKSQDWQVLAATAALWPFKHIFDPDLNLVKPTAWIFGNEAWGLTKEDAELADEKVAIPIYGSAESLNLAIAAAICLFASSSAQRKNEVK